MFLFEVIICNLVRINANRNKFIENYYTVNRKYKMIQ